MTFRRNGSNLQIEGIDFPGGRFVAQENGTGSITLVPHYHITDHLGSVRAVVDGSTGQVVETNDYYPFGKRWDSSSSVTSPNNRFRFNGKEDQVEFGTPYSDYGARQYSASTGRWLAMDPLAEKYYSYSPYAFCNNNPVNLVDLDGLTPRLYIQKSGLGHAFVTTGEGNNTIVYTYGRYGALRERSGSNSGMFTPKGEGVLFRLDGEMAVQYLSDVRDEGNVDIYQISNGNDQAISEYFDQLFVAGTPPTEPTKNSWNNPSAKVIDT